MTNTAPGAVIMDGMNPVSAGLCEQLIIDVKGMGRGKVYNIGCRQCGGPDSQPAQKPASSRHALLHARKSLERGFPARAIWQSGFRRSNCRKAGC